MELELQPLRETLLFGQPMLLPPDTLPDVAVWLDSEELEEEES